VFGVRNGGSIETSNFMIGVHERPVEVRQFRKTYDAAIAAGLGTATYSPLPVLNTRRADRRWMHGQAGALEYADGRLLSLARRVSTR
jgi:hypothetical protein